DRRPAQLRDHVGHREGLARAGDTKQRLVTQSVGHAVGQPLDRLRLVARGQVGLEQLKRRAGKLHEAAAGGARRRLARLGQWGLNGGSHGQRIKSECRRAPQGAAGPNRLTQPADGRHPNCRRRPSAPEPFMTLFSTVESAPRDPILGISEQFAADPKPYKVNLGVGMYYDENGRLPLLKCVAAAEQAMVESPMARGYLPIDGMADYDRAAQRLAFGDSSAAVTEHRIATVQGLGGTGALKVAADFLKRLRPDARVLIRATSWEKHGAMFTQAGFAAAMSPYCDSPSHGVRFAAMLGAL